MSEGGVDGRPTDRDERTESDPDTNLTNDFNRNENTEECRMHQEMAFSFGQPNATATTTQESAAPIFGQTTTTGASVCDGQETTSEGFSYGNVDTMNNAAQGGLFANFSLASFSFPDLSTTTEFLRPFNEACEKARRELEECLRSDVETQEDGECEKTKMNRRMDTLNIHFLTVEKHEKNRCIASLEFQLNMAHQSNNELRNFGQQMHELLEGEQCRSSELQRITKEQRDLMTQMVERQRTWAQQVKEAKELLDKEEHRYKCLESQNKKLQAELATNLSQYERKIQKLQQELQALNKKSVAQRKEMEAQLEKERDRSKNFKENAGIFKIENKRLQEELATNLSQYEGKIQKLQQELQAFNKKSEAQQKEMEARLEKERDRSNRFKENAGVLKSENMGLREEQNEQNAKVENLQQDLQALREKNALHDQQGVDKTHLQELEARARSAELGIVHLQKCVEIGKLRQAQANAEKNVCYCDSAIAKILAKQPLNRPQLVEWQTHKFGWENVVRDIQRIVMSQDQGFDCLVAGLNSGVSLATMEPMPKPKLPKSPDPPKPAVARQPVRNDAKADTTANQIDLIFSDLKKRFPDLTREMVVAELLALKERSGGKLGNRTFKTTVGQIEQVLAAKLPKARPTPILDRGNECVICHVKMGSKDLTECTVCHHKYHNRCVNEWLKKQKDCPMCRSLLLPDNDYPRLQ